MKSCTPQPTGIQHTSTSISTMFPFSNKNNRNPLSGRNSAGPRFQFRVRSIARNNLYLPLRMKSLQEIQRLLNGESPLVVFNCDSILDARQAFYRLRKRYDFPYWAALEHYVPDMDNPLRSVPLVLNLYQHHVVDVFSRRAFEGRRGLYLISKSVPKCGLSTVVQAYILWLQIHNWHSNSISYASSSDDLCRFKANLCSTLKKTGVMEGFSISVTDTDAVAYFNTYMSPGILSGIDCGFLHLADMSKWNDRTAEKSSLIFSSSVSRLQRNPAALVIMEGDKPADPKVMSVFKSSFVCPDTIRYLRLEAFGLNPFFLDNWLMVSDPDINALFHHIDLDYVS